MPAVQRKNPVPFPPLDKHLVEPEVTRDEFVRGRKVIAMPALPAHGDQHCDLDFLIRGHVRSTYRASTDLITRFSEESDFASDTSVRRRGVDPKTGERYLEELSFEVVNTQSEREIRERAEDLSARGVRRVFAVFVKKKQVAEWSAPRGAFVPLGPDDEIEDRALVKPLHARAVLDAAEANVEVVEALLAPGDPAVNNRAAETLLAQRNPVLEDALRRSRAELLLAMMRARFGALPSETEARVLGAGAEDLEAFAKRLLSASSVHQVLSDP